MAFTTIGFNGLPTTALTMDAAFFSRPLSLDPGFTGYQYRGIGFEIQLDDVDHLEVRVGPFDSLDPVQNFVAGFQDIFQDGSPELVISLSEAFLSVIGSGIDPGYYWWVRYYTLEPGAAAEVDYLAISLRPGEEFGSDGGIIFGDLTGLSAPTTYLNELGPGTVTPATYYDREADNRISSAGGGRPAAWFRWR